jgi:fucose permease
MRRHQYGYAARRYEQGWWQVGSPRSHTAWRNALFAIFFVNGLGFSSWLARVPAIRDGLEISTGEVAALLFTGAMGAVCGLLFSSHIIAWLGQRTTIVVFGVIGMVGLAAIGLNSEITQSYALTIFSIVLAGAGNGIGDVALNVEGASIERAMHRNVMPWFHAFWSLGTVSGAGLAAGVSFLGIGLAVHATAVAAVAIPIIIFAGRLMSTDDGSSSPDGVHTPSTLGQRLAVWKEPRTLAIGVIALGMAFAEGSANDWLALAMVDGREFSNAQGALWFGFFTAGMLIGRISGVYVLDRFGRVPVLQVSAAAALIGLSLVILVANPVVSIVGVLLWGLGSSLGFPVGMSAAADVPEGSAARVSAVATVAYGAFLIGPPLIGGIGEFTGLLTALWVVAALIAVSFLAAPAARPPQDMARESESH